MCYFWRASILVCCLLSIQWYAISGFDDRRWWMVVYTYEFSLQSIKAMRFNSTFPRTFWSLLVHNHVRCINLVIMKVNDGLSCETIVRFFYKHNITTDFCGTIPRATLKTTNLMQWHGTICIVRVFLLSEREISPNYTGIIIDFVHGFGSYVNETIQFGGRYGFGSVSVRIRCICETALIHY